MTGGTKKIYVHINCIYNQLTVAVAIVIAVAIAVAMTT